METTKITAHPTAARGQLKGQRSTSLFCLVDSHGYCSGSRSDSCECECHYEPELMGKADIFSLAVAIYDLSSGFSFLTEGEKTERYAGLIAAAEGSIDFQGLSKEEILLRMAPTAERNYYSRSLTEEELFPEAIQR